MRSQRMMGYLAVLGEHQLSTTCGIPRVHYIEYINPQLTFRYLYTLAYTL